MENDKKKEEIIKEYGKVSRQILKIIEEEKNKQNKTKSKDDEGER